MNRLKNNVCFMLIIISMPVYAMLKPAMAARSLSRLALPMSSASLNSVNRLNVASPLIGSLQKRNFFHPAAVPILGAIGAATGAAIGVGLTFDAPVIVFGLAGIGGFATVVWAYNRTLRGTYEGAKAILDNNKENMKFIEIASTQKEDFLKEIIKNRAASATPLVDAFNQYSNIYHSIIGAKVALEKILTKIKNDDPLYTQVESYLKDAKKFEQDLQIALAVIRQEPNFKDEFHMAKQAEIAHATKRSASAQEWNAAANSINAVANAANAGANAASVSKK